MKQKINVRLSLIALVAIIATAIGITLIYYNLFQTQVRDDLKTTARLLSDTSLFQDLYDETEEIHSLQEASSPGDLASSDNLRITWIAADGTVLYDNDTPAASLSNHLNRPEIQDALKTGSGECIRNSATMNMNTYYYALLLDNGTILRVAMDARDITSVFLASLPVIGLIVIVIMIVCILLGHLLADQLLRPINMMAEHLDDSSVTPIYRELEPFADKIRSQHENILAAAESRQDFTANVSHELKTPLTAISGYAELIENHMIGADQEAYIASQIHHNADRLLSLINDIIQLSELDHTTETDSFIPLDLYEVASECCRNLQISASQRQVFLRCSGTPAPMTGDKDMLKELIENLVQNAIRYNRENGHVQVTVSSENGHAILSVTDTGIGIPADQQSRVFERFYRVDKSRSRETGGTGLGLAIVKHIAEIHNAEIRLESTPGHGTRVTVAF